MFLRWDLFHINLDTFLVYHDIPKRDSRELHWTNITAVPFITEDFNKEKHIDILTRRIRILLHTPVAINNNEVLFILPII